MGIVKIKKNDTNTPSSTRKLGKAEPYIDDYSMLLNDDKESAKRLNKYVKKLKAYIRKTDEYKHLMKFLKRECGMNVCGYHHNITEEEFGLNIHHYPFCTEDIIYTILYKRTKLNESIRFSAVADEYLRLHYLGLIGLYPLCETCHDYKHAENGKPFIPFADLYGDPEMFFELYQEFMQDRLVIKFKNIKELNKGFDIMKNYVPQELMKHYLYVTNEYGMHFIQESKLKLMLTELLKD